jgi:hypothetical protein
MKWVELGNKDKNTVLDIVNFDKGNDFQLYTQRFQTYVSKFMELFKKANGNKDKKQRNFYVWI